MRPSKKLLCALAFFGAATPACAGPVLDDIRAHGALQCGGVERPGLIAIESDAKAFGLELDLCRALAFVVLGPQGRLQFRRYDSEKAWNEERDHLDDVSFLTAKEMIDNKLVGKLIPGQTVFLESRAVMVHKESPFQRLNDLAGHSICFYTGRREASNLDSWFAAHNLDYIRMPFTEDGEMNDSFSVYHCEAVAGEITTLADTRAAGGPPLEGARLLPETLAAFPIVAATPVNDGEWAAIVAWTIDTLMRADSKETKWNLGGVNSLRINAPELGLAAGWQKSLIDTIGTYGDLYEKDLGEKSGLKLPRGLNASTAEGGALEVPYTE
jgi:general L-amino acid transport system substrate-binding protein